MVRYGSGWKELHFISVASELLGFGEVHMPMFDLHRRRPQPSTWTNILQQRDSMASVTIYRSTKSEIPGAVLSPQTREVFEQKISSSAELESFGVRPDEQLLSRSEIWKEVLVVVKRGHDADIENDGLPCLADKDIRQWACWMTWAEIKRDCVLFGDVVSDDERFGRKYRNELVPVAYDDVDEYTDVWISTVLDV